MDGNPRNSTGFRGTGCQGAYKKKARWAAGQVIDFPWVCVGCGGRIRTYDLQVMSLMSYRHARTLGPIDAILQPVTMVSLGAVETTLENRFKNTWFYQRRPMAAESEFPRLICLYGTRNEPQRLLRIGVDE